MEGHTKTRLGGQNFSLTGDIKYPKAASILFISKGPADLRESANIETINTLAIPSKTTLSPNQTLLY